MEAQVSIPQLACMLVNSLFLKLVVSKETRTRTEAARPWIEILAAENIPVVFDEENGVFVVSSEALDLERDAEEPVELPDPALPGKETKGAGDNGFKHHPFPLQDDSPE